MEFPTLYKKRENKWVVWNIWVVQESPTKCVIKRRYGQENGKMIETTNDVTKGKNIGKSNETNVFQQACNDARSLFNKQKDTNHYSTSKKYHVDNVPRPMLAHSFEKQSLKINFPCFVQPKLDGVRMICDTACCYSRTGKLFDTVPMRHITDALSRLVIDNPNMRDFWFDGELFSTELMFEDIVGACRTSVVHDETKYTQLQYHVYDIVPTTNHSNMIYEERYKLLKECVWNENALQLVVCSQVESKDDIYDMHDQYVSQQYEGIMIRNKKGVYKSSRSYDLQKYKKFVDHEFEITDVKEAVGSDAGSAIIQCKTNDSVLFWVRPKGSLEYRTNLLKASTSLVGKTLTVRYQNLTDKGVPRFPVGVAIREYE
jgi:ATP-dependent DNA ligase